MFARLFEFFGVRRNPAPAPQGTVSLETAPAKPPINVCDDEEGIPNHQVNKFQKVAANSPARITQRSIALLSTVLATVFPTLMSKTQNAIILNVAAQITA